MRQPGGKSTGCSGAAGAGTSIYVRRCGSPLRRLRKSLQSGRVFQGTRQKAAISEAICPIELHTSIYIYHDPVPKGVSEHGTFLGFDRHVPERVGHINSTKNDPGRRAELRTWYAIKIYLRTHTVCLVYVRLGFRKRLYYEGQATLACLQARVRQSILVYAALSGDVSRAAICVSIDYMHGV